VAGVIRGVKSPWARNAFLGPVISSVAIAGHKVDVVHLAHPGILMRGESTRNPWPAAHREHIDTLRPVMAELELAATSVGELQ
jgi:hypothetical protein